MSTHFGRVTQFEIGWIKNGFVFASPDFPHLFLFFSRSKANIPSSLFFWLLSWENLPKEFLNRGTVPHLPIPKEFLALPPAWKKLLGPPYAGMLFSRNTSHTFQDLKTSSGTKRKDFRKHLSNHKSFWNASLLFPNKTLILHPKHFRQQEWRGRQYMVKNHG